MKIALESRSLKRLLSGVLKIGASGDATHPGFSLLHVEVTKRGAVRATAVNAAAAVRMVAPPKAGAEAVSESGAIALPLVQARTFADVLPDTSEIAAVSLIDSGPGQAKILRVKVGDLLLKQPTVSADETVPFPMPPSDESAVNWRKVKASEFTDIVGRVCWAVAPSNDHRPTLQGLHVRPGVIEATDAHKVVRMDCDLFDVEAVLPPAALAMPAGLVDPKDELSFAIDRVTGRWWCGGASFMLTARTIDGEYPKTDHLFIDETRATATTNTGEAPVYRAKVDCEAMSRAGRAVDAVFISRDSNDAPTMRFTVSKGDLTVITRHAGGIGIDIAHRAPWKFTGAESAVEAMPLVNARYVARALDAIGLDEVDMTWMGQLERMQFSGKDMKVLVMARRE